MTRAVVPQMKTGVLLSEEAGVDTKEGHYNSSQQGRGIYGQDQAWFCKRHQWTDTQTQVQ